MNHLQERNRKIINAVIRKANAECYGSLALLGVYGSFLTGDIHEKSDLDLLVLINDDRGYKLSLTFILTRIFQSLWTAKSYTVRMKNILKD